MDTLTFLTTRLSKAEERHSELERALSDPQIISDQRKFRSLAKERGHLEEIMKLSKEYRQVLRTLEDDRQVIEKSGDEELIQLARSEIDEIERRKEELEKRLRLLLLPRNPNDAKDVIVEIRAGTGGGEACLFVADLYRMYVRFAERQRWKVEVLNSNPTGLGGFKEIIFALEGNNVYGKAKYESGVHRVQRVPVTEHSGRIHTSAASVAVLPEAEEVEVNIKAEDLRIDVFRSSGPGGQSVNTTDSAVRITHIPTGTVVTCQDEKSQHKNKSKAMKVLRARLYDLFEREQEEKIAQSRKLQVKSGDRSDKIRTYNFPQGRVTDHRIGLTLYRLFDILAGDLDEIIEALQLADEMDQMGKMRE